MARSAHLVRPGGFLPNGKKLASGHYGIWCEACEYARPLPRNLTAVEADYTRRLHIRSAHLDGLLSGAMVLDEDLQ